MRGAHFRSHHNFELYSPSVMLFLWFSHGYNSSFFASSNLCNGTQNSYRLKIDFGLQASMALLSPKLQILSTLNNENVLLKTDQEWAGSSAGQLILYEVNLSRYKICSFLHTGQIRPYNRLKVDGLWTILEGGKL